MMLMKCAYDGALKISGVARAQQGYIMLITFIFMVHGGGAGYLARVVSFGIVVF